MLPGTQKLFKHAVPPPASSHTSSGIRVSLSFRRFTNPPNIPSKPDQPPKPKPTQLAKPSQPAKPDQPAKPSAVAPQLYYREKPRHPRPPVNTILILGSSITKQLDPDRLVTNRNRSSISVVNLSISGAKMDDMLSTLKLFHSSNPTSNVIKIICQPGTNDIRGCGPAGPGHLKDKLFSLVSSIGVIYPKAEITLQTLTPIRSTRNRDNNPTIGYNVVKFNSLILEAAHFYRTYLIDVTRISIWLSLNSYNQLDINPELFIDDVHLSKKGLIILARLYKRHINP